MTSNQSTPTLSPSPTWAPGYIMPSVLRVCIWLLLFNCQPAKTFLTKPAILSYRLCWGLQDPRVQCTTRTPGRCEKTYTCWEGKGMEREHREWSLEETRHTFKTLGDRWHLIPEWNAHEILCTGQPIMWTHLPGRYPKSPEESRWLSVNHTVHPQGAGTGEPL